MQWLIDLVTEAIGIPPVYIDRGDTAAWDFEKADFDIDGAWHELDLSAIVPEGAQAVYITSYWRATALNRVINFRRHGNSNNVVALRSSNNVADVIVRFNGLVACDEDRKIDFNIEAGLYNYIYVTISGWIL